MRDARIVHRAANGCLSVVGTWQGRRETLAIEPGWLDDPPGAVADMLAALPDRVEAQIRALHTEDVVAAFRAALPYGGG